MSLSCWTHIQNHLYPIIINSGRSFGRIGNYNGCISSSGMDYYMIKLAYLPQPSANFPPIAACLPEQCTPETLTNLLGYILKREKLPF